jgi:hypothetical protein
VFEQAKYGREEQEGKGRKRFNEGERKEDQGAATGRELITIINA